MVDLSRIRYHSRPYGSFRTFSIAGYSISGTVESISGSLEEMKKSWLICECNVRLAAHI